mgnify:CR=1 FL=1
MSNVPPNCGDVSPTRSVLTVSNVGSAPLLARRNLPLLDEVPCGSFANVIVSSAISALVSLLDCSNVFISAAVWSSLAFVSTVSSFVPSAATSRPSTDPVTVISPVTTAPDEVTCIFVLPPD